MQWSCGTWCRWPSSSSGARACGGRAAGCTSTWTIRSATTSASSETPCWLPRRRGFEQARRGRTGCASREAGVRVQVIVVGRAGRLLEQAIADYEARAGRYWSLEVVEVREERAQRGGG